MKKTLRDLLSKRIVPVVTIDDAADTAPLVDALCQGGLAGGEITLRTPAALEAIAIAGSHPEFCAGAGTVLSVADVDAALAAGARFIVSPGFDVEVVRHCMEQGVDVIPGVATASEIQAAMKIGLDLLKFFPAEALGGLRTLKAFCAVYRNVRFMPTGGISPLNLEDYLKLRQVLACGGSWMVQRTLIAAGDWNGIAELTRQAVVCAENIGV